MTTYSMGPAKRQDQLGDDYVRAILTRYNVPPLNDAATVQATNALAKLIHQWADRYLIGVTLSGSHAKGTAIRGANDIDLFVSIRQVPNMNLRDVYNNLDAYLKAVKLKTERRRVAIKVTVGGVDFDIVPGRKSFDSTDHWLYHSKRDSWVKTNITRHIRLISNCKRIEEIRAIKVWRELNGLDFPSLYLEMTVINALRQRPVGRVSSNVWAALTYLANSFASRRVLDPANTNNVISADLSVAEKGEIVVAARRSLQQRLWENVIW